MASVFRLFLRVRSHSDGFEVWKACKRRPQEDFQLGRKSPAELAPLSKYLISSKKRAWTECASLARMHPAKFEAQHTVWVKRTFGECDGENNSWGCKIFQFLKKNSNPDSIYVSIWPFRNFWSLTREFLLSLILTVSDARADLVAKDEQWKNFRWTNSRLWNPEL